MEDHLKHRAQGISRRGLFEALMRPVSRRLRDKEQVENTLPDDAPRVAIIQGRFCLAYQGSVCFTCSERCPEEDAITLDKGIPTVHADICTGCGVCHDLCPAPRNAVLMAAVSSAPNHTVTT